MKKKDITYTVFQSQIKDKDTSVNAYIDRGLAMCQSMFLWDGLPDSIPQKELERLLQTNGNCFVTQVDGTLYALQGAKGGEPDVYDRPTVYTVSNVALQLNRNYDIAKDGVLIENDSNGKSLLPLLGKYAVLMTDAQISLNTASILSRITMLISASDDKTKASAELFLQKILNGDFSIIGESAFLKGVQMQTAPTSNTNYINQLIELVQYYRASLCNDLGLNANYNMKRERLNLGETSMNIDLLLPYVDDMLRERQTSAKAINEMYGTEITVELNSSWALNRESYVSELENAKDTHEHPTEQEQEETETEPTEQETGQEEPQEQEETETEPTEQEEQETEQEEPEKEKEIEDEV
jgi:hypothetical protein